MKKKRPIQNGKTITIYRQGRPQPMPATRVFALIQGAQQQQRFDEVIQLASQLVAQQPGNDDARLALYQALVACEQWQELTELCNTRLTSKPRDLLSLEYGAHGMRQQGMDTQALGLLEKAVSLCRTDYRLLNALGTAYKELGQTSEALDCFQRATTLKPIHGQAYWNRSDIITDTQREISLLENGLKRLTPSSKQLPYFYFSLYRAYEGQGDTETAFHYLEKANSAKRSLLGYSPKADLENDAEIVNFFSENFSKLLSKTTKNETSPPPKKTPAIFIVGMPRSGSSLVEQIISSHSRVRGGGEIPILTRATETVLHKIGASDPFPHCLLGLSGSDYAQIGRVYKQLTETYLGKADAQGARQILTDKFLLNYKAVPLIQLALPDARVIHIQRDPMDTCFGCYRQLFSGGLGFCYDQQDLAKTYLSYQSMIRTWESLPLNNLLTISYESLITDFEETVQQLLEFCKLDMEPRCLDFHNSKRPVKTASSLQVRQPIFTSGVERWKPYEEYLSQLKHFLQPAPAPQGL